MDPTRPSVKTPAARLLVMVLGAALMLVGLALWVLPVLPGVPIFLIGLVALAAANSRVAEVVNRLEQTLPDRLRKALRPAVAGQTAIDEQQENVSRFFEQE